MGLCSTPLSAVFILLLALYTANYRFPKSYNHTLDPSKLGVPLNIAVVGAGLNGLPAAKWSLQHFHNVTIFEKSDRIGGIWTKTYLGTTLQNFGDDYAYTDFADERMVNHPDHVVILSYLEKYAKHFGLLERVLFNSEVKDFEEEIVDGDVKWRVFYTNGEGDVHSQVFDFVFVADGFHNAEPRVPTIPGIEKFEGTIAFPTDYQSHDYFKGKDVVVLGMGKSGIDMSSYAGMYAKDAHWVYKRAKWRLPMQLMGADMLETIATKFGSDFVPCWRYNTRQKILMNIPGLYDLNWKFVMGVLAAELNITEGNPRYPTQSTMVDDMCTSIAIMSSKLIELIEVEKKVTPHLAEIVEFTEDSVILSTGEKIHADTVVLATGTVQNFNLVPKKYQYLVEKDGIYLYRHILHPEIKNFAFIGYHQSLLPTLATEIGVMWTLGAIRGDIELPNQVDMLSEIDRVKQWKREQMKFDPYPSVSVNSRVFHYVEELLNDMGVDSQRRSSPIADYFSRLTSYDYSEVLYEFLESHGRL